MTARPTSSSAGPAASSRSISPLSRPPTGSSSGAIWPTTVPARASPRSGDFNGDGFDDLIVGANYGDNGGTDAGEAYVIFGKAGGFTNYNLGLVPAANRRIHHPGRGSGRRRRLERFVGRRHQRRRPRRHPGRRMARRQWRHRRRRGLCHLRQDGRNRRHRPCRAGRRPTASSSRARTRTTGWELSVSSAGDINGDGFDDIIVGAPLREMAASARRGLCHLRQGGRLHQYRSRHPGAGRRIQHPGRCRRRHGGLERGDGRRHQRRRL